MNKVADTVNSQSPVHEEAAVLACRNLRKVFSPGEETVVVLRDISMSVAQGDRLAIVGSSGSGKSTLLHLLGGLDVPTSGSVAILGRDFSSMSDAERGRLRNEKLGFVYQFHHLLPEFSALENVAMPLLIRRMARDEAEQRAADILKEVGLGHRLSHAPAELSGGERQRAAIARALVTRPACVLADEPTGNLDRRTADVIFDLILELNERWRTSFVIVTHDDTLARRLDRIVRIEDGQLLPA